jgi:hypothetical protein
LPKYQISLENIEVRIARYHSLGSILSSPQFEVWQEVGILWALNPREWHANIEKISYPPTHKLKADDPILRSHPTYINKVNGPTASINES